MIEFEGEPSVILYLSIPIIQRILLYLSHFIRHHLTLLAAASTMAA